MNILLAGATGLIGRRLASELAVRGHTIFYLARPGSPSSQAAVAAEQLVYMDYATVPDKRAWLPVLKKIDVVINAVGIFREQEHQSFEAIHTAAPKQLFAACAEAGVAYIVQLSALGADADARTAYHLSKRAADDYLRTLPVSAAIIQPSLIYAAEGSSARLFRMLASLPCVALPDGGQQQIQPVHVQDVVTGIANLVEQQPAGVQTIAFTGAQAITLRAYLSLLRQSMGLGRQAVLPVPIRAAELFASVTGHLPNSLIDAEALQMLARGNTASNLKFTSLLGRPPQDAGSFISAAEARPAFSDGLLTWSMPALRYILALVWIWTGIVSLWLYPVAESYSLLARTGFTGSLATVMLYAAGTLDLLLGVLTLGLVRRWRPYLWASQFALIAIYTFIISMYLPEFWIHPYGPILKNLPMLCVILMLWVYESRQES